jgi:hypothetical protein
MRYLLMLCRRCEFPCKDGYRAQLHEYGRKVGEALSKHGAMERFGVPARPSPPWLQPPG